MAFVGKRTLTNSLPAAPAVQRKVGTPGKQTLTAPVAGGERAPQPGKRTLTESLSAAPAATGLPGKQTLTESAAGEASAGHAAHDQPAATGGPLPDDVRKELEASFGVDLSEIRVFVHGPDDAIGAKAYTQGNEIHFAFGVYDPSTPEGKHILSHEVAHFLHQKNGMVGGQAQAQGGGTENLEDDAEHLGARAASGEKDIWPHGQRGNAASTPARQFYTQTGARDYKKPSESGFRSRYSGAPLDHDKMVVTIAAQGSQSFWHSYVVFEWIEHGARRHELFHFNPAKTPTGGDYTNQEKYKGVPGHIDHVPSAPDYLPQRDGDAKIPTTYRSWVTGRGEGMAGFQKALALKDGATPEYELTGYNCADFAIDVAKAGGVNASSWVRTLIPFVPTVPRIENSGGLPLDGTEGEMWRDRETRDGFVGTELNSLAYSGVKERLISDVQHHRIELDEARRRYALIEGLEGSEADEVAQSYGI